MKRLAARILFLLITLFGLRPALAQDDDLAFRALKVKGNVMAYHNENDETSRLYTSQSVGDGDKVILGRDCEAVLRLKGKAYLYLAPRTKVNFQKIRMEDKGWQCRVNLVTGRMVCQLDQPAGGSFEVSAGSVLFREHGTLFQVSRRDEELLAVSFQGAVVAEFHGKAKIAKDNEVLKLDHGKFRNLTHHLTSDQQGDLEAWRGLYADLDGNLTTAVPH